MLWKLLVAVASIVTSPFRGPVDPNNQYPPYGPQNWQEEIAARQALQGPDDDIRYIDDPSYAGINNTNMRWPGYPGGGTLVYKLEQDVASDQKLVKLINDAIKQYETNTCIRFKKRTNEKDYVSIFKDGPSCYAHVGKLPRFYQPQKMSLGPGCEFIGTVVHEIGHALGLFHEHQRSDRDRYLTVYIQNVAINQTHNFNKTDKIDELTFGAKYDYTSIMHYGEYAFSSDPGFKKTMVANDGKTRLKEPYERPGLNKNDIALVKKLYKCK